MDLGGIHTLINRRVFAYCASRVPDGIKCDTNGNVYSGCGDGTHVWDSKGVFLGKIKVDHKGCANLVFGPPGTLFMLGEDKIYRVDLAANGARK